ncbi:MULTISPECIES: hypothetical protein [unclassified Aureispira]|uniref:hypothetical protein n=1 Tax=unclassified Aureispira TaxID=2649989 RepID=UPI0006978945|nr:MULTISPECIES: hypothetical protein [unclassified Aureispira]WMX17333.1 hypothetical protein QP953_13210 [Aureispira sp. CCB-E]
MKKIFTLFILSILFVSASFGQSQKTFVKSLAADASSVAINLEGTTQVREWEESFIRVTTTIELTNFNEEILKRLVSVGRYNIETTTDNGVMTIQMPKLATKVTIRGQVLNEVLTYEILVPEGVTVEMISNPDNDSTVN